MRACLLWIALPLAAQTAIVDSHTSCLLGGWHHDKWINGQSLAPFLRGPREYRVIGGNSGVPTAVKGSDPKPISGPCGDDLEVPFDRELPEHSVAVSGNPAARKPESLPVTSRAYVSAFRALLDERGVKTAVHIDQLLRVDLEGNGKLAVLASLYSKREPGTGSNAGDYSMIVVRRLDAHDHLTTQVVDFEKHPREGGVTHMTIGPIVDVNGDGKAELLIRGEYIKGRYSHLYEWQEGRFVRVLECTCGE